MIVNGSLFAQPDERLVLGLEVDYQGDVRRSESLTLVPQVHLAFAGRFNVQAGTAIVFEGPPTRSAALLRVSFAI
ncbi:MAG: hypothetical protein JSW67_09450 [Candidatus Latescibacterota bacterium]|nr:MAG: hypothetical protein JSW67_09450 [Candidatus Latescibacterota bacterium]